MIGLTHVWFPFWSIFRGENPRTSGAHHCPLGSPAAISSGANRLAKALGLAPWLRSPSKWAKGYSAQVKTEGLGTPISGIFQQLHGDCYFRFVHFVHFASVFVAARSPQGAEVLLSASYAWPGVGRVSSQRPLLSCRRSSRVIELWQCL